MPSPAPEPNEIGHVCPTKETGTLFYIQQTLLSKASYSYSYIHTVMAVAAVQGADTRCWLYPQAAATRLLYLLHKDTFHCVIKNIPALACEILFTLLL